jgi:hypothetical protein
MTVHRIIDQARDGFEVITIDGKNYRHSRVQNTDPYYSENAFLRNNIKKEVVNKRWALPVAQIPYADYVELVKRNPELKHTDAKIRTEAWFKFLRTSTAEQLRTVRKNLIPGSQNPDLGSTAPPKPLGKVLEKENAA